MGIRPFPAAHGAEGMDSALYHPSDKSSRLGSEQDWTTEVFPLISRFKGAGFGTRRVTHHLSPGQIRFLRLA